MYFIGLPCYMIKIFICEIQLRLEQTSPDVRKTCPVRMVGSGHLQDGNVNDCSFSKGKTTHQNVSINMLPNIYHLAVLNT